MSRQTTYIRSYPVEWPVFSVKNYKKNEEGWWEWCPRIRIKKKFLLWDEENAVTNCVINENDDSFYFRSSR